MSKFNVLIFFLFISLVISIGFNLLFVLNSPLGRSIQSNNPLDVDLLITPEILLNRGFKQAEISTSLQRNNGDHLIGYDFLPTTGLVYTKYEMFFGLNNDGFNADEWINNYGGILCSDWTTFSNGVRKAYVLHRKAGHISSIYIDEQDVILFFDFPDIGSFQRSKNRQFDKMGGVLISDTVKRLNHKEIIRIQRNFELRSIDSDSVLINVN
ncbi:MAG TPA: hypothetical protein PLV21_10430 [Cyclobacteriaceae bacterium]|nr:hypothetical protein [Cyclobacteriaceae bacterium]